MDALDAIVEIFAWVGFGAAAMLGLAVLIVVIADGTWLPAQAAIDDVDGGRVARWWDDDGSVHTAQLTEAEAETIGGQGVADIWYRRGFQGRMRLTYRAPAVRALGLLALALAGVGVVAVVLSWVLLFVRG